MNKEATEQDVSAKADFVMALVLVALGIFVFCAAYAMPRLETRGVHPSTIPGLVPMALGAALAVFGGLLGWRSWRLRQSNDWTVLPAVLTTRVALRVIAAVALVFIYALGLIGWLPFWAASMIFIFAFVMTFEVFLADEPDPLLRSVLWALGTAIFFGGGIFYLFAEVFLVRLP